MTTNPPILTYTLEEILSRLDQKIEKQFTEVNQKMDRQFAEVNQKLEIIDNRLNKLEIGQAELSGEIKTLDEKLSGEIKTLEEKVIGIDKRLDNQEFINRGVLVAVIIALISGVVKLFGFFPTGKI
jgi:predicted RNase H-like nuclease (RuvC/YqgF family)